MKLRLSSKLILSIVLIEMLMLTALVWNSVRLISTSHSDVLIFNLTSESDLLANLLAPGLAVNDRAIVLDALSLMKKNKNIVYAEVSDIDGNRMASFGEIPKSILFDETLNDALDNGVFDVYKPIELYQQALGSLTFGYSVEYVEKLIDKTRLQNTLIASLELILSIVVTLIVGYFLTRNLRKLEFAAIALTRGELDHRIDLNSQDEIGDLARSFNQLSTHLEETQFELYEEHDALEKQTKQLGGLLNGINAIILEAETDTLNFTYVSSEAETLLGYPISIWSEKDFLINHIYPEDLERFQREYAAVSRAPGTFTIDFRFIHQDGSLIEIRDISTFDIDDAGDLVCRSIFLDVTDQKKNEQRIVYLANHDVLTGLYNRHRFQQELEKIVEYGHRYEQSGALVFVDLDQFKYINDTMGHQAGDEFLIRIAESLSSNLRVVDVLGRLGGDEFGIILPNTNKDQVEIIVKKLMRGLIASSESYKNDDMSVTASFGVVIFPEQGIVPGNLLAKADAAMYSAKDKGRNTCHFYDESDKQLQQMHEKLEWEQRIREALEDDLFVLHFQPIFDLVSRQVVHYEVLLRLQDGENKLIAPGAFLGIAERFGMIRDIDRWVLQKAIQVQAKSMEEEKPVSLAINISGRHFGDFQVLDWIKSYIKKTGADPSRLIFEITETAAVENITQARFFTDALHDLGCKIALDDFGIGFSSFHYLKHLPVDIVKLDGSFVRNLGYDEFDKVFVKSMSDMAKSLNIKSVAEFVEREETIAILNKLGVDMGQGYHLARPSADFYTVDSAT